MDRRIPLERPGDVDVHSALASPTRQRMLTELGGSTTPPTAKDLARALDLHVTTVRFHLDQLAQAGLVVFQTEHTPHRGRPAVHYRAVGLNAPPASEQMIDALSSALAASSASRDEALAAGRRWADALATDTSDVGAAILEPLGWLGFDPEQNGATIRLRACPFRAAARRNPEVVCLVHLGLVRGLAERAGDAHVDLLPFVEPELCLVALNPDRGEPVASQA